MQVFAKGEPVGHLLKYFGLGGSQPTYFRGPVTGVQARSRALVNSLAVQLFTQFSSSLVWARVLPGNHGCQRMTSRVHPNQAVPEGISSHRRNRRSPGTGSLDGLIYAGSHNCYQLICINRDFTFAGGSEFILFLHLYTWHCCPCSIKKHSAC